MEPILVCAIFMVAGMVKGLAGLGLPTVAMALLGLRLAPVEAVALLVVPGFLTNLWQACAGREGRGLLRRLWPLLAGLLVGMAVGGALAVDVALTRLLLAETLMLYAMLGLLDVKMRLNQRWERVLAPLAGLSTGILAALTGVFIIPLAPYLNALSLTRQSLIQSLGIVLSVATLAMGGVLAGRGNLAVGQLEMSVWSTVPAVAGMMLGGRLRRFVPALMFRRGFFIVLFGIGLHILLG